MNTLVLAAFSIILALSVFELLEDLDRDLPTLEPREQTRDAADQPRTSEARRDLGPREDDLDDLLDLSRWRAGAKARIYLSGRRVASA